MNQIIALGVILLLTIAESSAAPTGVTVIVNGVEFENVDPKESVAEFKSLVAEKFSIDVGHFILKVSWGEEVFDGQHVVLDPELKLEDFGIGEGFSDELELSEVDDAAAIEADLGLIDLPASQIPATKRGVY